MAADSMLLATQTSGVGIRPLRYLVPNGVVLFSNPGRPKYPNFAAPSEGTFTGEQHSGGCGEPEGSILFCYLRARFGVALRADFRPLAHVTAEPLFVGKTPDLCDLFPVSTRNCEIFTTKIKYHLVPVCLRQCFFSFHTYTCFYNCLLPRIRFIIVSHSIHVHSVLLAQAPSESEHLGLGRPLVEAGEIVDSNYKLEMSWPLLVLKGHSTHSKKQWCVQNLCSQSHSCS